MPDQVSFAKGNTKPTSGITVGRLYVVDSSTTDKSDLYLGKDATHLIQVGATVAQGAKADSSVQSINVGSTSYSPSSGVVSLPEYALSDHLYHYWTNNTYYYDDYSGTKNFRIVTENVLADTLRFQASTIGNKEYWDYGTSTWKECSIDFSNLFDGRYNSQVAIPYDQRKFRFTITANSGWPTNALIILAGTWYDSGTISKVSGTDAYAVMQIETRASASDAWSSRVTVNYPNNCKGTNAFCVPSSILHNGSLLYRITVELGSWVNTSNSAALTKIGILSNYNGSSLMPLSWSGTGAITARNSFYATTIYENGTSLSNKYLPKTGGTLSLAGSDGLKIKRTVSNAGAYVRYYNNNQDTNYWMVGMKESGSFMFNYNGTDKAFIDTAGTIHTVENVNAIRFRSANNDYLTDVAYENSGNEALVFKSKQSVTSFIFANGITSSTSGSEWQTWSNPGLQIKENKVAISKLIAQGVSPSYNLDVSGTANATTLYENGTALSSKYLALTGGTLSLPEADSLKIKRTVSGSGAFINFYNNNQDTNYWKVGMDGANPFKFLYNGTSKVEINTSGGMTANGDVILYTASGDSPRLTFQRGTLTDTYNDWSIYDSAGYLYIQQRGSGSTAWDTRAIFTPDAVAFSGVIREGDVLLSSKYLGISAKAADSSKLNGQEASYYLNYNNLTNKPTIPTTYVSTINGASGAVTLDTDSTSQSDWLYFSQSGSNVTLSALVNTTTPFIHLDYDTAPTMLKATYDSSYIAGTLSTTNKLATINNDNTWGGANTFTGTASISWESAPTQNTHLTNKAYVDGKFVDKSSNQTGIAGNKSWTGNQTWYVTGSNGEIYQSLNANGVSSSWSDSDSMHNTGWSLNNNVSFYANNEEAARYQNFKLDTSSDHILMSSTDMGGDTTGDVVLSDSQFTVGFGDTVDPTVPVLTASPNGVVVPNLYKTYTNASTNNPYLDKTTANGLYVDKSTNQTGIAGNKTWTGNNVWTGSSSFTSGASISKSESNKAEPNFSVSTEAIYLSLNDTEYVYSDDDTGVNASFYYSGTSNKKPAFDIYTQSYYSMHYAGVISTNGEGATLYYEDSDLFNNSSVQVKGRDIILTSDHEGIGAVSTTFHNDGGIMYLGSSVDGWVSINDIIAQITCFRGDTTYVTMYDGTKKLISDVKEGDSVLGYDVNKKDYCEAIVIKNLKTGEQMGYNCYVMEDGTTIDIHGDDNFITNVKNKSFCDEDGDYLSLHSMVKNLVEFHNKNDDTHKILKETGNTDGGVCLIHSFWTPCAEMTPRYSLYTSNGTMFVNGLLHAQSPRDTINIFRKRRFSVPDKINSIFDEIAKEMSVRDEALPNDKIANPDKAENLAKLNEAKVKIAVFKKKLADSDYKAMKFAEGAITEEEWLPIKEQRASWRHTVNRMEEIVAEYQPIVEEENPEMFDHDWKYKNQQWHARQQIFDDHLEDFREWQENIKEERQKRIEESKERSRLRAEEIKANKSSQKMRISNIYGK